MNMKKVNEQECITKVKSVSITLNKDSLSETIGITKGKSWDKEYK